MRFMREWHEREAEVPMKRQLARKEEVEGKVSIESKRKGNGEAQSREKGPTGKHSRRW